MAKTENHSVRFDEEKLAFFKEKNPNLITAQKVVDYFLDEFWWKHHGKWSHKIDVDELPTTGRQFLKEQSSKAGLNKKEVLITDNSKLSNVIEPQKPMGREKTNYTINTEKTNQSAKDEIAEMLKQAELESKQSKTK